VEINLFTLAFIAGLYTVVILITVNPISYLSDKYWGRRAILHKSARAEEINFALKEGQTIVGVMDTTKAVCFYIGDDVVDGKNYG